MLHGNSNILPDQKSLKLAVISFTNYGIWKSYQAFEARFKHSRVFYIWYFLYNLSAEKKITKQNKTAEKKTYQSLVIPYFLLAEYFDQSSLASTTNTHIQPYV